MSAKELSRRQVLGLGSVGAAVGMGLVAGFGAAGPDESRQAKPASAEEPAQSPGAESVATDPWLYVKLESAAVARDAYRLMSQGGGCMYALFGSILGAMSQQVGEPYASFPLHMMKYGEGGVALWGSLCGTLNGGAAAIGLFVPDKPQREQLIAQLFAWYESTELPTYQPDELSEATAIPKSVADSVLCHVSVGKWCHAAEKKVGDPEMKERCRRLTADVAAKTVELLNETIQESGTLSGPPPAANNCLSCHGFSDRRDTLGQMRCGSCHQQLPDGHPADE